MTQLDEIEKKTQSYLCELDSFACTLIDWEDDEESNEDSNEESGSDQSDETDN